MWLFLLALASAPAAPQTRIVDGEAFGPRRAMTCTWFTNFENSRFTQCRDAARALLDEGDGASIRCLGTLCARMDAAARKAAKWRSPERVWGDFTVRLTGRVGLDRHPKRFLGDATRTVLVEELRSVRYDGRR